jgi:hypothetical protein
MVSETDDSASFFTFGKGGGAHRPPMDIRATTSCCKETEKRVMLRVASRFLE